MDSFYYRHFIDKLKNYKPFLELLSHSLGKTTSSGPKNQSADLTKATQDVSLTITGLQGSATALILSRLVDHGQQGLLIVTSSDKEAEHLQDDLSRHGITSEVWPWSLLAPYSPLPMNSPIFGERVSILTRLISGDRFVLITSLRGLLSYLPPRSYLKPNLLLIKVASQFDPIALSKSLNIQGFSRVPKVTVPGEYALRGEVLDLLLPGHEHGYRIVFSYDKVEELRLFDPADQSSSGRVSEIRIHPFREVIWNDHIQNSIEARIKSLPEFKGAQDNDLPWKNIEGSFEGEEFWYPLGFDEPETLLDYLGPTWTVGFSDFERLENGSESLQKEFDTLYRKHRHSTYLPRPERIVPDFGQLITKHPRVIRFHVLKDTPKWGSHIHFPTEGPKSYFGNITFLKEELASLHSAGYTILIVADSQVQHQRLTLLLEEDPVQVLDFGPRTGFSFTDLRLLVIHENEIFGRRKTIPKSIHKVQSKAIDSFVDLEQGDVVVHISHGIGRFLGIQRIIAAGTERDYIKLEYANEETVFVPIEQVNLIQKYIGSHGTEPRLDKIGGKQWDARKERVRQKVQDLADHLILLYSKRKQAQGFLFPEDTEWQIQFETTFPFQETEDQITCIDDVKRDMEKPTPMDRLICGDVGFGKTEIAMRAAFKAVTAGKQVAFLAPTTILAEQHYESFLERLEGFPVTSAMLSRFVTPQDQKKVLEGIRSGQIDILIGTHRIIQKDVLFKDLGLMIVDEEQRFGVKDKERLKELKTSVDCLTLSATPIPRTLHMSLLKIRDMSVLKTPPYNRRPIETHVEPFTEEMVAKAIRREVARGGQVFYLHNRVESLEQTQIMIEKLVPEVMVDYAHGKMTSKELEDIMHRFIHGGFHVLLATTIIENGINIPNVNTIIIDRADMYGVSQLYQLRGRVGRSDRLAYAYLLFPGQRALSELAMKRLQIISDNTELGSGFKIALKDLEVRGAGNLLGAEQSGEIFSVGFDLYLKILDEAVRKRMKEQVELQKQAGTLDTKDPEIQKLLESDEAYEIYLELDYSGFIPDTYIQDAMEKMEVYKKISSISTDAELESVFAEIEDRFGPVPEEVHSLLALAELKVLCKKLRILSLKERRGRVEVEFGKLASINIDRLMEMIKTSGGSVKPVPNAPNKITMATEGIGLKEKSEFLRGRLTRLL